MNAPRETSFGPAPAEGHGFRALIGLIAITAGICGLGLLFFVRVPQGNKEALLLALGVVLGWGSAVVQSEYGASSTGRKAADATIRRAEGKDKP